MNHTQASSKINQKYDLHTTQDLFKDGDSNKNRSVGAGVEQS